MKLNTNKLRAIAGHAMVTMTCFDWEVLTSKQVDELGISDPPCAMLIGSMMQGFLKVTLDVDGEITVHTRGDIRYLPKVEDTTQTPQEIAECLAQTLQAEEAV
jgi:hypothetical protein